MRMMMKPVSRIWLCLLAAGATLCSASASNLKLWYNSPGGNGDVGTDMLLGNGKMGALISGQVSGEQVYLNDSSLWTGTTNFSGNYDEPNATGYGSYQYFGTLNINNTSQSSFSNYYRDLDIGDAIAHVSYSVGSTNYYRQYFCSHSDGVMVINLTASSPGAYSGYLSYSDANNAITAYTSNSIAASGTLQGSGIMYWANVQV